MSTQNSPSGSKNNFPQSSIDLNLGPKIDCNETCNQNGKCVNNSFNSFQRLISLRSSFENPSFSAQRHYIKLSNSASILDKSILQSSSTDIAKSSNSRPNVCNDLKNEYVPFKGMKIQFRLKTGRDTMLDGRNEIRNVKTLYHCINFMPEYLDKSMEEIRAEDYGRRQKMDTSSANIIHSTTVDEFKCPTPLLPPWENEYLLNSSSKIEQSMKMDSQLIINQEVICFPINCIYENRTIPNDPPTQVPSIIQCQSTTPSLKLSETALAAKPICSNPVINSSSLNNVVHLELKRSNSMQYEFPKIADGIVNALQAIANANNTPQPIHNVNNMPDPIRNDNNAQQPIHNLNNAQQPIPNVNNAPLPIQNVNNGLEPIHNFNDALQPKPNVNIPPQSNSAQQSIPDANNSPQTNNAQQSIPNANNPPQPNNEQQSMPNENFPPQPNSAQQPIPQSPKLYPPSIFAYSAASLIAPFSTIPQIAYTQNDTSQILSLLTTLPYGDSSLFRISHFRDDSPEPKMFYGNVVAKKPKIEHISKSLPKSVKYNMPNISTIARESPKNVYKPEDDIFQRNFTSRRSIKTLQINKKDANSIFFKDSTEELVTNNHINQRKTIGNNSSDFCLRRQSLDIPITMDTFFNRTIQFDPILMHSFRGNINCPSSGLICTRPGYYTNPSVLELNRMLDSEMNCLVDNFVIGRERFGKIMFPGRMNVANLNIDECVFFKRKEIIVYPDDLKRPPNGEGLNRNAIVTLEHVWPVHKTHRRVIKDPKEIISMGYHSKVKNETRNMGAHFINYTPETGTWIFSVDHFSVYGLRAGEIRNKEKIAFSDGVNAQLDNAIGGFIENLHKEIVSSEHFREKDRKK